MKKIIPILLFALFFKQANAQSNEIKVDVFDILALLALDVSYEHNLNPESSIGLAVLFNFAKSTASFRYEQEFSLSPYYRQRFFSRGNFDYYGEFFGSLNRGDKNSDQLEVGESATYTDFALGLGFGGKFISVNGFVADLHAGIGRNLFNTDYSPGIVPRVGISIGKQF
ncbi:hypothetical protein [Flavicella marina]|uniref:hypothetical protein n=1 Tax=Flavicella marina TaxID=1475951 RepID=UPI0012655B1E|nr:hypothetical protein [Flavicella marina]